MLQRRNRGLSHEEKLPAQQQSLLLGISKNNSDKWVDMKFENNDERITKFIEFLHNDPQNRSQLISDFQEWYLDKKPILSMDNLQRLFKGQMKKQGLFDYLQECHKDTGNIRTKTIIQFIATLLDPQKCHQRSEIVDEVLKRQPATYIQDCNFDTIINGEQALKESVFKIL